MPACMGILSVGNFGHVLLPKETRREIYDSCIEFSGDFLLSDAVRGKGKVSACVPAAADCDFNLRDVAVCGQDS